MFEVRSTSVETKRIARAIRVMQRRAKRADNIGSASVYSCKTTVGTTLYSAHSFGDAVDFMVSDPAARKAVALAAVADATRPTVANRGRKTEVTFVIYDDKQWTPTLGWHPYGGVSHTNHVHVGCSFSVSSPKPSCAGGSPYLPGVAYVKG